MENNETSAKKPRLKLRIIIIAVSVVIVALLIFVYLRVNPKWCICRSQNRSCTGVRPRPVAP
jgi:flagellar basal body-associated protein FliL